MPRRVIKASQDALAGLEIGENAVRLSGNRENLLYVDESGCYIVGNVSILAEPENVRIGSGLTFPPAYKAQLPSTAVNPQPILIANSPIQGFTDFASEVADLLGELL
jgi:hypothetical protein